MLDSVNRNTNTLNGIAYDKSKIKYTSLEKTGPTSLK